EISRTTGEDRTLDYGSEFLAGVWADDQYLYLLLLDGALAPSVARMNTSTHALDPVFAYPPSSQPPVYSSQGTSLWGDGSGHLFFSLNRHDVYELDLSTMKLSLTATVPDAPAGTSIASLSGIGESLFGTD